MMAVSVPLLPRRALEEEVEALKHAEKRRLATISHLTAVREKLSKQVRNCLHSLCVGAPPSLIRR